MPRSPTTPLPHFGRLSFGDPLMEILQRLLPSVFKAIHDRGVEEGRRLGHRQALDRHQEIRRQELADQVGRPVIVVPNEWDNPVIGFGHSIMEVGSSQVLVVEDYLTMEQVWCGGVRMDFSEQRLEVALTLDPYQLWAITAHNCGGHEDFHKPRSGQRWGRQRIMDTLEKNGFFERWRAFKERERA